VNAIDAVNVVSSLEARQPIVCNRAKISFKLVLKVIIAVFLDIVLAFLLGMMMTELLIFVSNIIQTIGILRFETAL